VSVNGPETHTVYRWLRLKGAAPGGSANAIPWNFSMFLVARDGEMCKRYSNVRTPSSIKSDVLLALDGSALEAETLDDEVRTSADSPATQRGAESPS